MFRTSWRRLLASLFRPTVRTIRKRPAPSRRRLFLEGLETRLAPAVTSAFNNGALVLTFSGTNNDTITIQSQNTAVNDFKVIAAAGTTLDGTAGNSKTFPGVVSITVTGSAATGETVTFDTNSQNSVITGAISVTNIDVNTLTDAGAGSLKAASFSESGGTNATTTLSRPLLTTAAAGVSITGDTTITVNSTIDATAAATGTVTLTASKNIAVNSSASVKTSGGDINLSANTAGTASGNFVGVQITGSVSTSGSGSISIQGHGGDTGTFNLGVAVAFGGVVQSGTGSVTVTGVGGASSGDVSYGVDIEDTGTKITSGGGSVQVTGTGGGTGTSAFGIGVLVATGAEITAGGTGTVTVVGVGGPATGGSTHGVDVEGTNSQITSGGGTVQVTGTAGASGQGVRVANSGQIASGGNAAITVTGDSMDLSSTDSVNAGAGTVTLRQKTNVALTVDASQQSGHLSLTDAELGHVTAGQLVLGRNDSGFTQDLTINSAIGTHAGFNTLSLLTGGAVVDSNTTEPDISVSNLALSASTGIGGAGNALSTTVSNLVAQTNTGGIFLSNTGALTIGFSGNPFQGVTDSGASGNISLTVAGTLNDTTAGNNIEATHGSVTLTTTGANSDILVSNNTVAGSGAVAYSLMAGRDVILDNGALVSYFINPTLPNSGTVTAARNISVLATSTGSAGIFGNSGGITLTTGAGGTFTDASGTLGVVSNDTGGNGNITISADNMSLNAPINAGAGIVTLQQAGTTARPISLGGGAAANSLGLSEAELGQVTASVLRIGRNDNAGDLTVDGAVATHAGFSSLALVSGGKILDGTSPKGTDVTVTTLALTAKGGIGTSGNDFVFNVSNLSTDSSAGNGNQFLKAVGTAKLGTANALNAGTGTMTLTGGTFQLQSGAGGNAIADSSQLAVNSPATLDLNGQDESVDGLGGNGTVTDGAAATTSTLTVGISGGNGTFSGVIQDGSGTVKLTKSGSGTETLSGTNTYTGATTVSAGTLLVNGSTASGSAVSVNNGGTLGGTGTAGGGVTVNTGGTINPGTAGTVGTLTVGSLSFNGGTYQADLDPNAGTADQIATAGTINLANPTQGVFSLNVLNATAPANGTDFTLIKNTGGGAIAHPPLANAPAGGSVSINGKTAFYTYHGEGGNSFELTVGAITVATPTVNSPINEGGTANLSGTFSNPDAADTNTVVINWGDGSPNTTLNLAAGVTNYSASHVYADNPAGAPHGSFPIGVTVSDDDGSSGTASTSITVNNVAPVVTVSGLPSGTQTFGSTVSGSFSFTDPGINDGAGPVYWQAVISYGDGRPNDVLNDLVPGTTYNFSRTYYHAGINPISVTVTDKDLESGSSTTNVTIALPTVVYANIAWLGTPIAADPDGAGPAHYFGRFDNGAGSGLQGGDGFSSINEAVGVVATGGTIEVFAGSYAENVNLSKSLMVQLEGDISVTSLAGVAAASVDNGGHLLTITNGSGANFAGSISGSGGLTKNGSGTQTLSGSNTYTGATTVNAGTLLVDGSTASASAVTVNGGTLGGTGNVQGSVTVESGGHLAPGDSPGILNTGSISLTSGANFDEQIANATSFDQDNVTGTVSLGGSTLNVTAFGTLTINPGDEFIIIKNDGSDAVTGTFVAGTGVDALAAGTTLAEGALLSNNFLGSGQKAFLTYQGGDGNDVAIVVEGPVTYNGTNGDDALELRRVTGGGADSIQFLIGGAVVDSRPFASVDSATVNGLDGKDTLTVNYGASGGFFALPVTFHGDDPTTAPGDKLVVTGSTFAKVVHTFTTAGPNHSGNIVYDVDGNLATTADQATIEYDGLEPVDMTGSTIGNLVFNLPSGTVGASLEDDGTAGNGKVELVSTDAVPTFETTTFAVPTKSLTVNAGGGTDTISTSADFSGDFNAALTINGTAATDTVTLNALNLGHAGANTGALAVTAKIINDNGKIDTTAGTAGNVSLTAEQNIAVASTGGIKTSSGNINLQANTAGTALGNFVGIDVNAAAITSTGSGNIALTGTGGNDAATGGHIGVLVHGGATVQSSGTGTVTLNGTGGQGTDANYGVKVVDANSLVTSAKGNIQITGQGSTMATGGFNEGILVFNGGQVTSTGTGAGAATITLMGTGGSGTNSNYGVNIVGTNALVTSVDGNIQITGQGSTTATAGGNEGILLLNGGQVTATGTATITLNGTGGSGTDHNFGVDVFGANSLVTSVDGNIQITGQGGTTATGNSNTGVRLAAGGQLTSTGAATITIMGTGGSGTGGDHGVQVTGTNSLVTSATGAIQITGQGGTMATGASNIGVTVDNGGQVTATGTATITLNGTGGSGTDDNIGVDVEGAGSLVTSVDGNIQITGQGGTAATGFQNEGLLLNGGQVTATGTATITLNGTGGAGTDDNIGVGIAGASAQVTSVSGNIQITGQGGTTATGVFNRGVAVVAGGQVTSTGSATVTINGTGGSGSDNNFGVDVEGANSLVTSVDGNIQITGQGGTTATGAFNDGVDVAFGGQVTSTGTATITLNGTGGSGTQTNFGVDVEGANSLVTSVDGNIQITGQGGTTATGDHNIGIRLFNGGQVTSTGAATIALNGTGGTGAGGGNLGVELSTGTVSATGTGTVSITASSSGAANGPALSADAASTISAASTADNITLTSDNGATVHGTVTTPGGLLLQGTAAGDFTLDQPNNAVARLAAGLAHGALSYTNSHALLIGTVSGTPGINTGGGDATLTTLAGALTVGDGGGQDITAAGATADLNAFGVMENTSSTVTSTNVRLRGTGTYMLDQPNQVGTVAAAVTGPVTFMDAQALTVGSVNGTLGITTGANNLTLMTASSFLVIDGGAKINVIDTGSAPTIVMAGMGATSGTISINVQGQINSTAPTGARITGGQDARVINNFAIRPGSGNSTVITCVGHLVGPNMSCPDTIVLQNLTEAKVTSIEFTQTDACNGIFEFNGDSQRLIKYIDIGLGHLQGLTTQVTSVLTTSNSFNLIVKARLQEGTGTPISFTGLPSTISVPTNAFVASPAFASPCNPANPNPPLSPPRLAIADVNGDSFPDIILANGPGQLPVITVINGVTLTGQRKFDPKRDVLAQFYAFDPQPSNGIIVTPMSGLYVAAGDLDRSGKAAIVASLDCDPNRSPYVRIFQFDPSKPNKFVRTGQFLAYGPNFHGGVRVAVGEMQDANGKIQPIIVTAPGPGAALPVRVWQSNGASAILMRSFSPYGSSYRQGISVAMSNLVAGALANDILTAPDAGLPYLRIYAVGTNQVMPVVSFYAFRNGQGDLLITCDPTTQMCQQVSFSVNSPIFGVSGIAFGTFDPSSNMREILVGTGIGKNAVEMTIHIFIDKKGKLTTSGLASVSQNPLLFSMRRAARGVFIAAQR